MAAAVVAVFMGGVIVLFEIILGVMGVSMFIAPYAGGALISVIVCEKVPGAKNLVPGHVVLNYLLVLFIVEVIIILLIRISQLNTPLNVLLTSFFQCATGFLILDQFHPDSIGFCVFLSIVYVLVTGLIMWINLEEWDFNDDFKKPFFRVLGGILYGMSAILLSFPLLGGVWFKFFQRSDLYGFIAALIMLALAIGAGIAGGVNDA